MRDELSKEFSIAGMVDNGKEAIRDVDRLDPDILVPDGHIYFQPMAA